MLAMLSDYNQRGRGVAGVVIPHNEIVRNDGSVVTLYNERRRVLLGL